MIDVRLMIDAGDAPDAAPGDTRFGGAPVAGDGFTWPTCTTCRGAMSFLAQLPAPAGDGLLLVFQCENDPGLCEDWDADAGGNRVVMVDADATRPAVGGGKVRPRRGMTVETIAAGDYDAARAGWIAAHPGRDRAVLGQLGGLPGWLQGDETPACDACARPMALAAQLEAGPDYASEMNFAGGCGYVFDCGCAGAVPKFLWQN